jgi:hypothetical protein
VIPHQSKSFEHHQNVNVALLWMQKGERNNPNRVEAEAIIETDCTFVRADDEVE